ncbi:MAG: DUF6768 family protein [Parasphingopyxis sp.]|uniref:DUF6768 family protein n=1 Tax=Parasphingopyxis sp. TaxID=1920299 RepID=UPI003FA0AB0E
MTEFDDRLRAALDADDEAFLKELDSERGLFAQIGDTLTGPLGGWAKLVFVIAFLMAMVMFYTIYRVSIAETDREFFGWALGALAALISTGMIKQWFFERMNLMAVLRELKRIELRVARMEERG